MNVARLTYLASWIRTHADNGTYTEKLSDGELNEVMQYRKQMGPAPIKLAQVIDRMIEDKQKEGAHA